MALCYATPATLGLRTKTHPKLFTGAAAPRGLLFNLRTQHVRSRSFFAFAASHEEKSSDIDTKKEILKLGDEESQEVLQQTLASLKEQALKFQGTTKEAYEVYSEKGIIILKETSEKLKIQAEKAKQDLSEIAKEVAEESKVYLENSPEPVKDIVETFASSNDELNDISKVRDFCVGIPYGALLSVGGFLSFMLTGSIPAIRFGTILGGALLALSISSLTSWKKGESSPFILKGQTAIATILFLRELRLLSKGLFIANMFTTLISGGVAAFYIYRLMTDGKSSSQVEPEY